MFQPALGSLSYKGPEVNILWSKIMYMGQGVISGPQRPDSYTLPWDVFRFSSANRLASGPTTIMPPSNTLEKWSATIENVVRYSGTFKPMDGPA